MRPARTCRSACSAASRSLGWPLAAAPGGLAAGPAGGQGVEAHRGGDLAGPQHHLAAGGGAVLAGVLGDPRVGGQVVGGDGHPVALADGAGGAAGQGAVGGDLDPAGDLPAGLGAGRQVEGQPQLDAGGAVAEGEVAGVGAEGAGDGDGDRVHGVLPCWVAGRVGCLVAAWVCGALPDGQATSAAKEGPATGRPGRPRCFPPSGKDLWPSGASAARARLREPTCGAS